MVVATRLQLVGALLLPLLAVVSSFDPFHRDGQQMNSMGGGGVAGGPFIPPEYARFADVKRQCKSVLSAAAELTFDANRANGLMPELSFVKGDWKHDGGAPLMPFDGTDVAEDAAGVAGPLSLASFSLTHVDAARRGRTALNVSGVLGVAISRNGTAPEMGPYVSPEFKVWPGNTELKILLEGVYTENDDGESVLCMVGDAVLPKRGGDAANPWDWARHSDRDRFQPPITKDGNILLVLRYPKTLTLRTRAIRGELTSTNGKTDAAYFDAVHLLSQLGAYSNYNFGSDELVGTACKTYPYRDDLLASGGSGLYKGTSFCGILDRFTSEDVLAVVPNWKCNTTDALCRRLGPFETDKAVEATDGGFAGVSIVMQEVRCEPRTDNGEISARVSAVFRAVPPWEHAYTAAKRSGLGGMTLSAEGVWRASTGQLCMVACLGVGDKACHSRVCLYVQTTFSATRRSITVGQITRISGAGGAAHFPLTFQRTVHPVELWSRFGVSGGAPLSLAYSYTKTKQAGEFLRRSEPFDFGTVVAKSLLSYPRKSGDAADETTSLSNLAEELTLHVPAVPDPFPRGRFERPFLQLEVLSLGSLIGRATPRSFPGTPEIGGGSKPSSSSSPSSSTKLDATALLNVSAELTLSGEEYVNVSTLSLEGVYNPVDGRMYLVGCRRIQAPWRAFSSMGEVEEGMDCSIEVRVEYPPTTARWLINPTAKVHIASTRGVGGGGDPLRFNATALQTLPILYREQRQDILSRRSVEGILRIPGRVPSDRRVLAYTTSAHLVGFMVILAAHYVSMLGRPVRWESSYMDARGEAHALREWAVTMEEYIGLAQDLFLLPQVVGNVVWRVNCRPRKTGVYAGWAALRLLPHLYDYIRAPAINPYFAEEYEFVNTSLDFYSKFGDVAIPLAAVALAAAVYVQQRWNYKIISKTVKTQQKKLQHLGSRVYERLPSMSSANFEAELVSGVNDGVGLRRDASLS
uniref:RING-type E3 ubiquitin transferase n=1 Tax=Oryza brachyantha TaxID=4533 RepID=J3KWX1_ORYBR